MVLKIGDVQWHLHFYTKFLTPAEVKEVRQKQAQKGYKAVWDKVVSCYVHTGQHVWTYSEPKYCVCGHVGVANCSTKEPHFDRRRGHKTALGRALSKIPKEARKPIWDAYWQKVRRPKEDSIKFKSRLARLQAQQAPQSVIQAQTQPEAS